MYVMNIFVSYCQQMPKNFLQCWSLTYRCNWNVKGCFR